MQNPAYLLVLLSNTAETDPSATPSSMLFQLVIMVIAIVAVMFFMSRSQKKKDREAQALIDSVQVGDEVVTVGGIVGIVIKKAGDTVVIETANDRNKLRIKLWAIRENVTAMENSNSKKTDTPASNK